MKNFWKQVNFSNIFTEGNFNTTTRHRIYSIIVLKASFFSCKIDQVLSSMIIQL